MTSYALSRLYPTLLPTWPCNHCGHPFSEHQYKEEGIGGWCKCYKCPLGDGKYGTGDYFPKKVTAEDLASLDFDIVPAVHAPDLARQLAAMKESMDATHKAASDNAARASHAESQLAEAKQQIQTLLQQIANGEAR